MATEPAPPDNDSSAGELTSKLEVQVLPTGKPCNTAMSLARLLWAMAKPDREQRQRELLQQHAEQQQREQETREKLLREMEQKDKRREQQRHYREQVRARKLFLDTLEKQSDEQ